MNKLWCEKNARFRTYLKDIRNRSGQTQTELAESLGKPQSYVSKYESGERKLDFLETIEVVEACGKYDLQELVTLLSDTPKDED